MARILILIAGPVWSNPRSQKEADALAQAGHDVEVAGIWHDDVARERDERLAIGTAWKFTPLLDLRAANAMQALDRVFASLTTRAAGMMRLRAPELLGPTPRKFLRRAAARSADLTIVRSEVGLWAGNELLKRGMRVGVDFEDWYSENYAKSEQVPRRVAWIKSLEKRLATECTYRLAASQAMADALGAAYGTPPLTAVYNSFPELAQAASPPADECDRKRREAPSIHWFSQTIGPGRGLEAFFQAAEKVSLPFEVHLRGNVGGHARWLDSCVAPQMRARVFVHPTVPNDLLPLRIAEHDIGLALESTHPRSRDLTITNKLLQYMQGGLAVIATDTAGQREVFKQAPGAGLLVKDGDLNALRGALVTLLGDSQRLQHAKAAAAAAFRDTFSWDRYRARIVRSAEEALAHPPPRSP